MKWKKKIGWVVLVVAFGLMLVTAIVFLVASSVPPAYLPYRLNHKEQKDAAKHFVDKHGFVFLNKVMENQPFTHSITESDLNMYLAALDEIAFLRLGKQGAKQKSEQVLYAMDKAGMVDPVVKIDNNILTMMVRWKGINKVISLDLLFEFDDDDRMGVVLDQVRVGRMPVPQSIINDSLTALKEAARNRPKTEEVAPEDLDALLAAILGAIGEEPIPATIRFSRKRLRRIRNVELEDGVIKIHVVPVLRD